MPVSLLQPGDIPGAQRLVEEARWNQLPADWETFIAQGTAYKLTAPDGRIAATAATLPYPPRFGWISMVLVTEAQRRRGIATALLDLCVQRLRAAGLVPVLDATPAGREVYRQIGFRDGWGISRWRRGDEATSAVLLRPTLQARALQESDWPALAQLDARAFGADRAALLRQLAVRSRAFACVVERDGRLAGFLLGRDGRVATQFGPVVAEDADVAKALLAYALPRAGGTVLVDALVRHDAFTQQLAQAGFSIERPYTRMALEFDGAFGEGSLTFAIAGPELG